MLSKDGSKICFYDGLGFDHQLWLLNPAGGPPKVLTSIPDTGFRGVAWSPDGTALYVAVGNTSTTVYKVSALDNPTGPTITALGTTTLTNLHTPWGSIPTIDVYPTGNPILVNVDRGASQLIEFWQDGTVRPINTDVVLSELACCPLPGDPRIAVEINGGTTPQLAVSTYHPVPPSVGMSTWGTSAPLGSSAYWLESPRWSPGGLYLTCQHWTGTVKQLVLFGSDGLTTKVLNLDGSCDASDWAP